MFGFCLLSTLAMVYVKRHATLPPDTLIGVFHALTLGLGLCLLVALTRQFNVHQVESVLFGSLLTVTDGDLGLLVGVGIVVAVLLVRQYNHLLLDSLSPPLATVAGAEPAYLEYFFALLLTLSIVVSLKIIGALLVEALIVVPAAAARNVATRHAQLSASGASLSRFSPASADSACPRGSWCRPAALSCWR